MPNTTYALEWLELSRRNLECVLESEGRSDLHSPRLR